MDPDGVLPMLTLVATAPEVAAWHAGRGVPADISAATLTDLGQQVWVHRLTFGTFGLHTHGWLTIAWSGALYWLGRLQFNLQPETDGWVLSTHIPRTGPLTPATASTTPSARPAASSRPTSRTIRSATSSARAGCSTPP